jgi:hypothetical protein
MRSLPCRTGVTCARIPVADTADRFPGRGDERGLQGEHAPWSLSEAECARRADSLHLTAIKCSGSPSWPCSVAGARAGGAWGPWGGPCDGPTAACPAGSAPRRFRSARGRPCAGTTSAAPHSLRPCPHWSSSPTRIHATPGPADRTRASQARCQMPPALADVSVSAGFPAPAGCPTRWPHEWVATARPRQRPLLTGR